MGRPHSDTFTSGSEESSNWPGTSSDPVCNRLPRFGVPSLRKSKQDRSDEGKTVELTSKIRMGGRLGSSPKGSDLSPRSAGFGLVLMLCAQFMVMLDASIVTVATPGIQRDLGFSAAGVQAVITAYNTVFGGALILSGRIGDLLGRRTVFICGMVGFAATSLLCALAPNNVFLVAGRALQGLSAAMIAPTALSLLTTLVPEGPQRVRAMSRFGVATVLGFISGLVLSGVLVQLWGWRGVFFATVPVGLLVAGLAPRFISPVPRQGHRIDLVGATLITVAAALIVAAPTQAVTAGWTSQRFLLLVIGGIGLLAVFVGYELRHPEPLVRLGLFRSHRLRAANVVSLFSGMSSGAAYLLVTMYLQEVLGYSPVKAGFIVAPVGILNLLLGTVLGKWITRLGIRFSLTAAAVASGAFIALVGSQVSADPRLLVFAVVLLPMGMAFMCTTVTSTLAATTGVENHEQGLAAGVRQTSFQLGIAIGVAVLVPLASSRAHSSMSASPSDYPHALADGIQVALFVLAAFGALAGIVAFRGLRPAERPPMTVTARPAGD
jgi:EmrB/QacA subfamily drug resistance transporter